MSTTLTRWPSCAWCSMSRLRREMSTHRRMRRQDCGGSWIVFRAIAGRHLRGDSGFGTEAVMREAEQRGLPDRFKLRLPLTLRS